MADKSTIYLLTDEIDHLTLRYTDYGEKLDRFQSIKKIRDCIFRFDFVKEVLKDIDVRTETLNSIEDEALYQIMLTVRTQLLKSLLSCNILIDIPV
ncbi:MAG: hypothetical protein K6B52_01485 [Clostridiales bacterium]|nr:hypothetical protein [Clostridiales bacterium]